MHFTFRKIFRPPHTLWELHVTRLIMWSNLFKQVFHLEVSTVHVMVNFSSVYELIVSWKKELDCINTLITCITLPDHNEFPLLLSYALHYLIFCPPPKISQFLTIITSLTDSSKDTKQNEQLHSIYSIHDCDSTIIKRQFAIRTNNEVTD